MLSANSTIVGNSTGNSTDRQPSVSFVAILGVVIVIGTLANGYVLVVLMDKSRRSTFNMTIVNLAIVDTLVLLVVIPMCLVTLLFSDFATRVCSISGILSQVMMTYSLHVQCLILYANFRIVTNLSLNNKATLSLLRLTLISVACLAVDTCVVVYPKTKYGSLQKLSSAGFCFFIIDNKFWSKVVLMFYVIHLSTSVLLCTIFYIVLTRFVRKNSARKALARQRQIFIFKMMFRKLLIWVLCYSFIFVTRIVGYENKWPEVTFQASYVLLWSNSVLNPLCHILTSPLRRKIVSWWSTLVATVHPQGDTQLTNQRTRGSDQHNSLCNPAMTEQCNSVSRSLQDRMETLTYATICVTDAEGNQAQTQPCQRRTDTLDRGVTKASQHLTTPCQGNTGNVCARRQRLNKVTPLIIQPDNLSNTHLRFPVQKGVHQLDDQTL